LRGNGARREGNRKATKSGITWPTCSGQGIGASGGCVEDTVRRRAATAKGRAGGLPTCGSAQRGDGIARARSFVPLLQVVVDG
jgi:hypothetical protein